MKFVHAADIHLDSPMRGLDRYEGAPAARMRGATRRALENLIDLCISERAELLVIAGDLFDGDWRDYNTGLFFAAQMSRLREADIPVVLIKGNHDAQSQVTRALRLPENVKELSVHEPETFEIARLGVCVHGQGFAHRSVKDDLASRYPDAIPGLFNIGLLHTCAEGREGHDDYAPCSTATLVSKGYDYWALGHVHAREELSRDPWIVFPGNLQGRHAKETGAKGASVVIVENGRVASVDHRAVDVVRWAECGVDLTEARALDDAIDIAKQGLARAVEGAEGRPLAARLVLRGRTRAHVALEREPDHFASEMRQAANDSFGGTVWLEKIRLRTSAHVDMEELRARDDAVGELSRAIFAMKGDPELLRSLLDDLADLRHKLPPELSRGPDGLNLDDPETLLGVLDEVEQLLVPRLLERERA